MQEVGEHNTRWIKDDPNEKQRQSINKISPSVIHVLETDMRSSIYQVVSCLHVLKQWYPEAVT